MLEEETRRQLCQLAESAGDFESHVCAGAQGWCGVLADLGDGAAIGQR